MFQTETVGKINFAPKRKKCLDYCNPSSNCGEVMKDFVLSSIILNKSERLNASGPSRWQRSWRRCFKLKLSEEPWMDSRFNPSWKMQTKAWTLGEALNQLWIQAIRKISKNVHPIRAERKGAGSYCSGDDLPARGTGSLWLHPLYPGRRCQGESCYSEQPPSWLSSSLILL